MIGFGDSRSLLDSLFTPKIIVSTENANPSQVEQIAIATASILDLQIPDTCRDGILANFQLLGQHARVVEMFDYPTQENVGDDFVGDVS